jgi:hypothetical protein
MSDKSFDVFGAALESTDRPSVDGPVVPMIGILPPGEPVQMLRTRILELDGSLAPQADLFGAASVDWIPAEEWGPRIRLACPFGEFDRFSRSLGHALAADGPCVTFYGSGDFHHVTLALLDRIREPFNLLILDKHPDWIRGIPFLHCGTWLHHALRLPHLRRVFHCGGDTDFDNAYRWLAPWPEIVSGRVVVFPACRRFSVGGWAGIPVHPLLSDGIPTAGVVRAALKSYLDELRRYPLYISVDKDVLTAQDAAVNWDSGLLRLEQALAILETFLAAAEGRMIAADVLGDWSPVRLGHRLNRLCDRLDHPSPELDPADAARRNRRANAALLRALSPVAAHAAESMSRSTR